MSHYHSARVMAGLSTLLREDNKVLRMLPEASNSFNKTAAAARRVLTHGASALAQFATAIDTAITALRAHRPREVFAGFMDMNARISDLTSGLQEPAGVRALLDDLQEAEHAYDNFVSHNYSREPAFELLKALAELERTINSTKVLLELAVHPHGSADDELEIFFPYAEGIREICDKLLALNEMYSILANHLRVSEAEQPLRIVHLSVGTLWVRAAGELGILRILRRLLIGPATDAYTAFSKEGKIRAIPRKLDGARALLELADEMEKRGIDSSEIKKQTKLAIEHLAVSYERLVSAEPYIEVDGYMVSMAGDQQRKLLAKPAPKQLGPGEIDDSQILETD